MASTPDAPDALQGWEFAPLTEGVAFRPTPEGAVLASASDLCRADLVGPPMDLPPLRRYAVRLSYEALEGRPSVLVGLRPAEDRASVSQAFVEQAGEGEATVEVEINTGRRDGPYRFQISILGCGAVRLTGVEARDLGPFEHPTKPLLALDIINPEKPEDGELRWTNIARMAEVYGFPEVVSVHFTEFSAETLERVAPCLIAISGVSDSGDDATRAITTAATRVAMESGIPLVGTCGGHQFMARALGVAIERCPRESGPTLLRILASDPMFDGLPTAPWVVVPESHTFSVASVAPGAAPLASSVACPIQASRYPGKPWYSFQFHPERDWEALCPAGGVIWRNVLEELGVL